MHEDFLGVPFLKVFMLIILMWGRGSAAAGRVHSTSELTFSNSPGILTVAIDIPN